MYGSTENRTSGSYVELDEHNDTNVLHKESTKAYVNNYHTLSISEICKIYKVDLEEGLNYDDVALLRRTHGYNKLTLPRRKNSEWIYNSLFSYFFCLITISMILAVIGGILLENIIILSFAGFLCSLIICHFIFVWYYWKHNDEDIEIISDSDTVQVIRNCICKDNILLLNGYIRRTYGLNVQYPSVLLSIVLLYYQHFMRIDSEQLVPGDIICIKAGDRIKADIRLFECSHDFAVDESILTGETKPNIKNAQTAHSNTYFRDADNIIFSGCYCVEGIAKGIVFAIGNQTFNGKTFQLSSTVYDINFKQVSINKWRNKGACCTCLLSIIAFILLFTINVNELIICTAWFSVVFIVISFVGLIVCMIHQSDHNFIKQLRRSKVIIKDYIKIIELCEMNVIIIPIKYLIIENGKLKMNILIDVIQKFKDLKINIVFIASNKDMRLLRENNITFDININGDKLNSLLFPDYSNEEYIEYLEQDNVWMNIVNIMNAKTVVFINVTSSQILLSIGQLQQRNGIVGFIGYIPTHSYSITKANIGIALNENGCDIIKDKADIILIDDKIENIVSTIQICHNLQETFGYKLTSQQYINVHNIHAL
eukprot:489454_1